MNIKTELMNRHNIDYSRLKKTIESGGTVVFPTETVYGLGANALDREAVQKIFIAKGRPQDNPLIVHIYSKTQLKKLVSECSEKAEALMERFWPGPLTILFQKSKNVPYETTAGLETIAIRMPDNEVALKLLKEVDIPLAAPSANISGRPSPTKTSHVIEDLYGKVDIIIEGEDTDIGIESTVIDLSTKIPIILRPGSITKEELEGVLGKVEYDGSLLDSKTLPKSPGQKYRHYSPKADLKLFVGEDSVVIEKINEELRKFKKDGKKVGILTVKEHEYMYDNENIIILGSKSSYSDMMKKLYSSLREFDKLDVDIILAEGVEEKGLGKTLMNRLTKSAGKNVEYIK